MNVRFSSIVLTGLLAFSPVAVLAQDSSQHMDNGASKMMKSADTHFAIKAAQGGMAEVKLGQLAAITLPGDVNQKQQATYDRLSKLSGADFDKQYVKSMVMDHEEDVKDFRKEANSGKDEKIKSFASQTLPTLQGHLDKIKGIQSKMGSGSSL
jgi:putative membrane protein